MNLLHHIIPSFKGHDSAALQKAVLWAVDQVDPRLKWLAGYPDCYRRPVATALDYAHALAAKVPGPVSVRPEAYGADPVVHAMFGLQEDLHHAMDVSRPMQAFRKAHPGVTEIYAMVCMRRQTKKLLGMEMQGEILRRDVRQEAVFFTDCTIAEPGLTEAESRDRVAWGFFESLVAHVSNRIGERKLERARLETERDQIQSQLRASPPGQRAALEGRLAQTLGKLSELVDMLELDHYCRDFEAVLLEPEKHVYLAQTEINLDSMGIVRDPATGVGDDLVFCDLIGRDRRRWTVTMMYCNHVREQTTITQRLDQAQRWLGM